MVWPDSRTLGFNDDTEEQRFQHTRILMQNSGYAETGAGIVVDPSGEQHAHWRAAYEIMKVRAAVTAAVGEERGGGSGRHPIDLTTPPKSARRR